MAVSDIIVKFGADMTALKAGFAEANKGTGDFESRMKSMGGTATAAGGAMTAGLTVPIMAVAAFAMKSASDVGGAFKTIEKSTGATGAQLNVLKGSFRDVFGNFPISADDAAQVVSKVSTTLKSLNGDVPATQAQITAVSGAFEQFAKVGGVDVSTATDTLMRSFKAMGMSADDVKPALNDITIAAQSTGDNTQRLIDSVAKGAPTFKSFGFGIEDTSAMMAKIDMSGVKSTSVITGLNKVLKQAAVDGVAPKKAFADINDELIKGTHTTPEATALYKELGVKGYAQLSIAAKGGAFDVQALTDKMADNQGAMEKSYNDTLTFGDRLTMFRNKLEIAFQPLGSAIFDVLGNLLDTLTPILNIVTGLAMKFSDMPKGIQTIVVIIGGLLAALGPVLLVVGKLMTSFTQIQNTLKTLAPMAEKLATPLLKAAGGTTGIVSKIPGLSALGGGAEGGGMAEMLAPVLPLLTPILVAVAAIAAVFAVLYATSQTFRDVVGGIVGKFQELFAWAGKFVGVLTSGNLGGAMDMLKKAIGDVGNMFATINWAGIGQTIIKVFQESFATISGLVGPFIGQIGNALGGAFNTLKNIDWGGIFAGALDAVSKFLDTLLNFDPGPMINKLIDSIGGAFDSLFGGSGKTPAAGSKGDVGGKVAGSVEKAGPDILGKLGNVFIKLVALLPTIFIKVTSALVTALEKVDWGAVFGKIGGAISGALGGIDWGGAIMGFFGAIAKGAVAFGAALLQMFTGVNWLQVFTLIFVTIKSFGQALINGLKAIDWGGGLAKLWTAIQTVLGGLVNWLKSLDWGGFATTIWNFIKGGGALGMIVNWLKSLDWGGYAQTVWNALKGAIGAIIGWIKGLDWGGYAQTVYRALTGAIGAIIGWLISLNWGGVAATFYRAITGAVGAIIGWLTGLDWGGIARTFYNAITGALGGLIGFLQGIDWGSVANTFFGKIKDALGGIVGFLQGIDWGSAFSGIGTAIVNAIKGAWNATLGGKGFSFDTHIPGVGVVGFTIPTLAQGGILSPRPGGVPVIAAERGEPEMFVPQHDWGKPWESLLSSYPHFGGGGIIGSVPSTSGRSGNDGGASTTVGPTYVTYVTVDSEDITRKVFASFLDNERYNMLGRKGSF